MSDSDRSASFYDGIASSYDRELARDPGYWWTRAAFRQFVADEPHVAAAIGRRGVSHIPATDARLMENGSHGR